MIISLLFLLYLLWYRVVAIITINNVSLYCYGNSIIDSIRSYDLNVGFTTCTAPCIFVYISTSLYNEPYIWTCEGDEWMKRDNGQDILEVYPKNYENETIKVEEWVSNCKNKLYDIKADEYSFNEIILQCFVNHACNYIMFDLSLHNGTIVTYCVDKPAKVGTDNVYLNPNSKKGKEKINYAAQKESISTKNDLNNHQLWQKDYIFNKFRKYKIGPVVTDYTQERLIPGSIAGPTRRVKLMKFNKNDYDIPSLTRLASLLGRIREICNGNAEISKKVTPLIEQATEIIETMYKQTLNIASNSHIDKPNIGVHVEYEKNKDKIANEKYKKTKKTNPLDKHEILLDQAKAEIRSRFRKAQTVSELEEIIKQASLYGMTHEIEVANKKIEKLSAIVV